MNKVIVVALLIGMCLGGGGKFDNTLPAPTQATPKGCFFDCVGYKKVAGIAFCTRWQWTCLGAR
jgi:hypothetical protein